MLCVCVILLYMCVFLVCVHVMCGLVVQCMCVAVLCIAFYTYNTWYCVCNDGRIVLFEGVFMTTCTQHTQYNIHLHTCTIHVYTYTIHTHNAHLHAPHIHKCAHTCTQHTLPELPSALHRAALVSMATRNSRYPPDSCLAGAAPSLLQEDGSVDCGKCVLTLQNTVWPIPSLCIALIGPITN